MDPAVSIPRAAGGRLAHVSRPIPAAPSPAPKANGLRDRAREPAPFEEGVGERAPENLTPSPGSAHTAAPDEHREAERCESVVAAGGVAHEANSVGAVPDSLCRMCEPTPDGVREARRHAR